MRLEEEFQDLRLTKKELKELKKRVLDRFPDWNRYNIKDVKELFKYSDVNKEVIAEEVRNIEKRRKMPEIKKSGKKRLGEYEKVEIALRLASGASIVLILSTVSFCSVALYQARKEGKAVYKAYNNAVVQYADTNKDGVITTEEKKSLEYNILKGKMVDGNYPLLNAIYADGRAASGKEITKWIEEYKPEK